MDSLGSVLAARNAFEVWTDGIVSENVENDGDRCDGLHVGDGFPVRGETF